jgi:hypothetical protein
VHTPPSPKAALALLVEVERLTGLQFGHEELAQEAFAWERGIDEMAESDEELSRYVATLEQSKDEFDAQNASGESLAAEFERYLRENEPPKPGQ